MRGFRSRLPPCPGTSWKVPSIDRRVIFAAQYGSVSDNASTFVCFTCWDEAEEPWAGETPAISEDLLDMETPRIPKSTPAISKDDLLDMEAPRIPKSTSTISEDLLDMETPRIPKSTPAAISEDDVLDMESPRSPKRLRSSALDESQTM